MQFGGQTLSQALDHICSLFNLQYRVDHDGTIDLALFEGVSSGLLSREDLADAAPVITPGSSAAILIFENRWATPFIQALRHGEAQLVAAGYIPQDDIVAALDAADG